VARAATTADVFNAVAEPRRREILDLLADGQRPVNDLVSQLGLAQPLVSKHLKNYEQSLAERFDRLDVVLEELKEKEEGDGHGDE